jgi:hypothetical protein
VRHSAYQAADTVIAVNATRVYPTKSPIQVSFIEGRTRQPVVPNPVRAAELADYSRRRDRAAPTTGARQPTRTSRAGWQGGECDRRKSLLPQLLGETLTATTGTLDGCGSTPLRQLRICSNGSTAKPADHERAVGTLKGISAGTENRANQKLGILNELRCRSNPSLRRINALRRISQQRLIRSYENRSETSCWFPPSLPSA